MGEFLHKGRQSNDSNRNLHQTQQKQLKVADQKSSQETELKEELSQDFSSPEVMQRKWDGSEGGEDNNQKRGPVPPMMEEEEPVQKKGPVPLQFHAAEEEEIPVQRRGPVPPMNTDSDELSHRDSSLSHKMPQLVQRKMESSFGQDFSDVNIHKNSVQSIEINAHAFTQGNDIHFAPGQYNPESQQGQELLGHELTHVVQQRSGIVNPTTQMRGVGINNDIGLEKEADDMGKLAAQGKMVSSISSTSGSPIQRKAAFDYFNHKVLENETLIQIATDFSVPLDKILELNNIKPNQIVSPGTIIKVPNPEKIKEEQPKTEKTDKPKSEEPDRLGLIDQKNQYLKVTAEDFEKFLNLYKKFSFPEIDAQGNVSPHEIKKPEEELKDLKYLLGPLQNANPDIKKNLDLAEQYIKAKGEKIKEVLTPDKAIEFVDKLWKSGLLGKIAIIIPAAAAAGGAGYLRYKSVELTLEGNPGIVGEGNKLFNQLLDEVLFNKKIDIVKAKDLNGSISDKPAQESLGLKITGSEKDQFGADLSSKTTFNKEINESDRNDWKEAKYDDKTIWYSMSNKDYYDTITLRHYIHKATDHKVSSDSQIVGNSNITTVENLMNKGTEVSDAKFISLKDQKSYTYAQIAALVVSGSIDKNTPIAKESEIKKVSEVDLLAASKLYGNEYMSIDASANGGFGLNKDFKPLNYKFGGDLTLTFPFQHSAPYLKLGYSQDKHYEMVGQNLNLWTEKFMSEFLIKIGANYKFDIGSFHSEVGGSLGYKQTHESTTNPSGDSIIKDEHIFSASPYFKVNFDKDHQTLSFEIRPEFMYQDEKFKTAFNLGLSGLKLGSNSFIKVNFKVKDNKLDTANMSIFYNF
ncbi:MAG: DUF4157 domain-containing protein [Sporocytophaga sp.]|uniref:eCIS core domain-containing protein n=1 Tax=Sporocytophaga sp. TaxID=2231183 RepID=UPI001B044CF1|nr:DUF4157 domain-containing protein [Sporocytophaga sp.]MBO9701893.1 DUF4157 domain-containing protein [Sporocytophaga sp.]